MQIKAHLDPNFESMTYYPTIYFNEFWILRENLVPLNETVTEVNIALDLTQMPMWKFTIFSQVEKSFEMQVRVHPCLAFASRDLQSCQDCLQRGCM